MRKYKKALKKLIIIGIIGYVAYILISQQQTLNQYASDKEEIKTQISQQQEYKEELAKQKEEVDSLEFIEETAREKLNMVYPNDVVYISNE